MKQRLKLLFAIIAMLTGLHSSAQSWATPKVSVTILRSGPSHSSEQVSQVVMGTPLKVVQVQESWWKVETPEGYSGYVRNNTLTGLNDAAMQRWRKAARVVVTTDRMEYVLVQPNAYADRVSDLVNGVILEVNGEDSAADSGNELTDAKDGAATDWVAVTLPDGRKGYVEAGLVQPIEQWANQQWNPAEMPRYAARFMGAPYVWGGTSLKGMDCSGLTQICAYRQGVMLPRDASQQVKIGTAINKSDYTHFQPGDLLFFGNVRTGKVTHVAISMGGPRYIHSSAQVRVSSLDPSAADYEDSGLIAVRRIDPTTAEQLALRYHPWYF
jgi:SH3-like domain-containing protein